MNSKSGNHLDDKQLVERILHGETHAFGHIVKSTEKLVAQIVFKMIANDEDRKDLAQDVYLRAFDKLDSFKFQSKISTWIAQIAYNMCFSFLEKRKLFFPGDGFSEDGDRLGGLESLQNKAGLVFSEAVESPLFKKESLKKLNAEIERLPPVYKTLVALYHQEEMGYEEIAQITGLPIGTVKSYLFRARKLLKENILAKYKRDEL